MASSATTFFKASRTPRHHLVGSLAGIFSHWNISLTGSNLSKVGSDLSARQLRDSGEFGLNKQACEIK